MLAHWLELFPEPDSSSCALWRLPSDAISARICRHPASWPGLVRDICTPDKDEDSGLVCQLFYAVEEAIKDAPEALWHAAREAGVVMASAKAVANEFLCGLTREQLVSADGVDWMEHIFGVLNVLRLCTQRARGGIQHELWDIRHSFLLSELTGFEDDNNESTIPFYEVDTLFSILNTLGRLTADLLQEHRNIALSDSCIPQIFLLIWIWSTEPSVRSAALSNLGQLATHPYNSADNPWPVFYCLAAADGCCDDSKIARALLRDLAHEAVVCDRLSNVLNALSLWQNAHLISSVALPADARLVSSCFAAARRQLCRGGNDAPGSFVFIDVTTMIFSSLRAGLSLSAHDVPAFLDLLPQYALRCMQDASPTLPGASLRVRCASLMPPTALLADILEWTVRELPALLSPKRSAMRTHTLAAWHTAAGALAGHQGTDWARCARLWDELRELIEPKHAPEVNDTAQSEFGLLERCAWVECLCSRHKPAHRMRLCKGCERVVYCGKRCQTSDWERGGHRMQCQKRAT
ncbi:zinc finger MYND domain-containing protein [Phanerochaete sordida]|uniref:Zinc finger MYND domain-containing protein n=1 Tax=Phanerochaete sordida TaxID=48140 RepID=A0A9P3GEK3_9APHY|nr:zinc finger MYND domain-containing protein [Phanerochaete sordida]